MLKTLNSKGSSLLHEVIGIDDGIMMVWQKLKHGTQVGFPRLIVVTPQKVTIKVGRHRVVRHGHQIRWWAGQLGHDTDLERRFVLPVRAIVLEFNDEPIRRIAIAVDPETAPQCEVALLRHQLMEQPPTWRRPKRYLAWLVAPLFGLWAGVLSCLGLFVTIDEPITDEIVFIQLFAWLFVSILGFGPLMIVTDRFYHRYLFELSPQIMLMSIKVGWFTGWHLSGLHWLWDCGVALVTVVVILKLARSEDVRQRLRQDPFPE